MARYQHLPIYQAAYGLALHVEQSVGKFPRSQRYGLGDDLRNLCRSVLRAVIRANSAREQRARVLGELRINIEELLVLVRLAKDCQAFANLKAYEQCANLALSVSRQTEGWLRTHTD